MRYEIFITGLMNGKNTEEDMFMGLLGEGLSLSLSLSARRRNK